MSNYQCPQMPNDGDINWGNLIKSAFQSITNWINGKADSGHNHDTTYAVKSHNHNSIYADTEHNHDSIYSTKTHDHNAVYAIVKHIHDEFTSLNNINNKITAFEIANTNINNRLKVIEDFLYAVQPDLNKANIVIFVTRESTGTRFKCSIEPAYFMIAWEILLDTVPVNGRSAHIYSADSLTNNIFVENTAIPSYIDSGTIIRANIRVKNIIGQTSAWASTTFTYYQIAIGVDKYLQNSDLALMFLHASSPELAQKLLTIAEETPDELKKLIRNRQDSPVSNNDPDCPDVNNREERHEPPPDSEGDVIKP